MVPLLLQSLSLLHLNVHFFIVLSTFRLVLFFYDYSPVYGFKTINKAGKHISSMYVKIKINSFQEYFKFSLNAA